MSQSEKCDHTAPWLLIALIVVIGCCSSMRQDVKMNNLEQKVHALGQQR